MKPNNLNDLTEKHYEYGLFARMKKGIIRTGLAAIVAVAVNGIGCHVEPSSEDKFYKDYNVESLLSEEKSYKDEPLSSEENFYKDYNVGPSSYGEKSYKDCKIAFASDRDGNFEVYVMNADGSNQKKLTNGVASPAWSPDRKKIAFSSSRDGNIEVYVINADGSKQRNLTNNPSYDSSPAWSPFLSRK